MMRHLWVTGLAAIGIALMAAQPARAAAVFICDVSACGSPDPNITFSMNDFEGGFQINSVQRQRGLGMPATFTYDEGTGPRIIDGAAR